MLLVLLPMKVRATGCNKIDPYVFFGNGMFNSPRDADISARALSAKLGITHVYTAYNSNESALQELLQVAVVEISPILSITTRNVFGTIGKFRKILMTQMSRKQNHFSNDLSPCETKRCSFERLKLIFY